MSTYANVEIQGREFHVRSNGGDKQGIRDAVRDYVKEAKGKVKPDYLARVVVDAIASDVSGAVSTMTSYGCYSTFWNL